MQQFDCGLQKKKKYKYKFILLLSYIKYILKDSLVEKALFGMSNY
jgi:hypothetical protein